MLANPIKILTDNFEKFLKAENAKTPIGKYESELEVLTVRIDLPFVDVTILLGASN
ncbi:hypothetical protein KIN20_026325 [Parelaphostrongylus tenuis]|uniref:Uncharacterized protein n=1 Tax=Parelaphostrongylus tenuis TaxID=148309 RepID=A0AAD5NBF2_PARTN|nr:hypothetical protein KIN20_026325 [Parelaphostrongylus tenuis]